MLLRVNNPGRNAKWRTHIENTRSDHAALEPRQNKKLSQHEALKDTLWIHRQTNLEKPDLETHTLVLYLNWEKNQTNPYAGTVCVRKYHLFTLVTVSFTAFPRIHLPICLCFFLDRFLHGDLGTAESDAYAHCSHRAHKQAKRREVQHTAQSRVNQSQRIRKLRVHARCWWGNITNGHFQGNMPTLKNGSVACTKMSSAEQR